ncbi:hypothetical protein [Luteolibacter sp. LG18]|uniref:hypothetical protein n=1 Tax=Luteolibacter sp. LG18 TaxID=2819286 RepID=UPI002B2C6EDF|nr:hypothetical protein llg_21000 [Luteolibacter sp. LG18]
MSLLRRVFHWFEVSAPGSPCPVTGWEEVTTAQWREWEADTRFAFPLHRMEKDLHQHLVTTILAAAERSSDRVKLMQALTETFGLNPHDAFRAVERVLGGVVRAATGLESPSTETDPLAARAFTLAWRDRPLVPAIRAQWAAWKPGDWLPGACDW